MKRKLFKNKFGTANITSFERHNRCNRGYILHRLSLGTDVVCWTRCAWRKLDNNWRKFKEYYISYFNNRCNRGDITSVIYIGYWNNRCNIFSFNLSSLPFPLSLACVRISFLKLLCVHSLYFCAQSCFTCLHWLYSLHFLHCIHGFAWCLFLFSLVFIYISHCVAFSSHWFSFASLCVLLGFIWFHFWLLPRTFGMPFSAVVNVWFDTYCRFSFKKIIL